MRARVPPLRVRALYREWAHSLEQGPVPDEHVLGDGAELDVLAAAAEDLFARKGRPPRVVTLARNSMAALPRIGVARLARICAANFPRYAAVYTSDRVARLVDPA